MLEVYSSRILSGGTVLLLSHCPSVVCLPQLNLYFTFEYLPSVGRMRYN